MSNFFAFTSWVSPTLNLYISILINIFIFLYYASLNFAQLHHCLLSHFYFISLSFNLFLAVGGGDKRESSVPLSLVSEPSRPMPAQAELKMGEIEREREIVCLFVFPSMYI